MVGMDDRVDGISIGRLSGDPGGKGNSKRARKRKVPQSSRPNKSQKLKAETSYLSGIDIEVIDSILSSPSIDAVSIRCVPVRNGRSLLLFHPASPRPWLLPETLRTRIIARSRDALAPCQA